MNWAPFALMAGGALLEGATRPDAPKIQPYKPKPVAERLDEIDPAWRSRLARQSDLADRLSSGEIPIETRKQIEMLSAERAWQGGFGTSERAQNLTARDLGLYSIDLMQMGHAMSKDVSGMQVQLALADAEMAYEAYASRTNAQLKAYEYESRSHANLWSNIFNLAGASYVASGQGRSGAKTGSGYAGPAISDAEWDMWLTDGALSD